MVFKQLKIQSEDIGSSIMETITAGLYANNLNCLREYVQNSIDGGASRIDVGVHNRGRTITLSDDGYGMDENGLRYALKVAFSSKDDDSVGWRGIGIWSGVAVCERVVIVTKKKSGPKYKVSIDSKPLVDPDGRQNKTAADVLNESVNGLEELDAEDEDGKSYTMVTLSNIHSSLAKIFSKNSISEYLSRTVPLKFHKDFKPGEAIISKLKEYGIPAPSTSVYVEGEEVFKDPVSSENVFETSSFKEFRKGENDNRDILAVGWFVNTNSNNKLKNPSVTYRKKGFRVGETSLVYFNSSVKFRGWQHGEIHVLDKAITENASRDGFSAAVPETDILFNKVGEFMVDGLEALSHYTSESLATSCLNKARKALDNNKLKEFYEEIETAERKGSSKRAILPELSGIKASIDEKAKEEASEIRSLKNKETGEEERNQPTKELIRANASRERMKVKSKSFHPLVKKHYEKRTASGKFELNIMMCDPLIDILEEMAGIRYDTLTKISKKAFDWDHIESSKEDNKEKNREYIPLLSVVGDVFKDSNDTRRNKEFGVFLAFLWDFFNTADRHGGLEKMPWYSEMKTSEREEWAEAGWTMIDMAAKMIERSEKIDPSKKTERDP
ncbi:MAG: ATP-binding protein [Gudongella sp.]|nr:ATP-binding protein [Gudongella sp.]